ncbi:cytochrome P450 [Aquabacterium sp.]|uniref:cytochrome P450 n=1 Tax=Aquabacterium sp. TaxID=1872578 RepID=UPI002CFFF9B3|nr:cytochrome P450 [Aquabacterium sp.]HSW06466.1 cytochrome P450 [Aquabacterium sp.]
MTPATDSPAVPGAGACQFSRHADVAQALHDPRLVLSGPGGTDAAAHLAVRAAIEQLLTPTRLASWRDGFTAHAQALIGALPEGVPVDLVSAVAEPWSLEVALVVTGAPRNEAAACLGLARRLFVAAAAATDGAPAADALAAAAPLAQLLSGPAARQDGMADVQTFVALSQTLPALLAGAWLALLRQPEALAALRSSPQGVARSVGELLRLGSPAHAIFRQAAEDVDIGGTPLRRGDQVALLLAAANRDPARFADPERLDWARDASAQLGFGAGLHRCAGASLVRMAVIIATEALLAHGGTLTLLDSDDSALVWRGGFALRAPASLPVVRRTRA